jgi:hypothetical protein
MTLHISTAARRIRLLLRSSLRSRCHRATHTREALAAFILTLSLAMLFPTSAQAARPGWITTCSYSHSLRDDPIVFPGLSGASHLHDFAGADSTDAFSTPASMRAGTTSCATVGDKAAYWVPALYQNGRRRLPTATARDALFYYRRTAVPNHTSVRTIPDGLKMVIGNSNASSPSENPQLGTDIIFKCGPGSTTDLPQPPTQCASGVMVLSVRFPNCWDGFRLDSLNHRDHMAYPMNGRCPASHAVNLPRVEGFWRYNVGTGPIGTIEFAGHDGMRRPYYTAHQDFFNAWEPARLRFLMERCINALIDCGINPATS